VNVDTGQFQALTARVERVEKALRDVATVERIMARAGMPAELGEVAGRESARQNRHLRTVTCGQSGKARGSARPVDSPGGRCAVPGRARW
jgi:hypothetical protein